MGRATRWLKSLLGIKNHPDKERPPKDNNGRRDKVGIERRWSFTKPALKEPQKENRWFRDYISQTENEESKHAIAVAAATAAAADAAVAAAQAAVAVVKLTTQARFPCGRDTWAAVKIQTLFRGYLARKALRALRGLVKLQALVRGYLVRKRAAITLQSMQALIRAQAAARSQRANRAISKSSSKLQSEFRPRRSTGKFDETRSEFHSKRLSASYEPCHNAHEGSPKIVEIDTYNKPRSRSRRINPTMYDFNGEDFQYPMSSPLPVPAPVSGRLSMPGGRNFHPNDYEWSFYGDVSTAQTTPRLSSSIRSNGPLTPTKSVCGDSFFSHYSNFPNYMTDTKSFKAKQRSQSAPKQRPEARPKKKVTLDEIMAARNSISGVRMQRCCSQVEDSLNF